MNNHSSPSYRQAARLRRIFPVLAVCLALTACGGGGGGGSGNTPVTPPATTLGGSVTDGPVKDALVKAFALASDGSLKSDAPLATATTAADGSYTLTLASDFSGMVVITATGGSYCAGSSTAQIDSNGNCPAGTVKTALGLPLVTLATASAGTAVTTAHLTPISTAALGATVASDGVVSGSVNTQGFADAFAAFAGGLAPAATPTELKAALDQINAMQSGSDPVDLATILESIRAGTIATTLANAAATSAQASFAIKAGGTQNLKPAGDAAQDPTLNTTSTAWNAGNTTNAYFAPRDGIDVATLKTIMEDASVRDVDPYATINVTVGNDVYTGYRLADVIVRATKFRPLDSNIGAFGAMTAVVAFGAKADGSTGRVAAFSFTELIRTDNGNKTIVAFQKNGADLAADEGALAIIPGNDDDKWLRKVPRLKEIHIRNDFVATTYTANDTDPALASFQVAGQVNSQISVTTGALSVTSSQGYYAVDKIGDKPVGEFKTYYFKEHGPRHTNYWWGQGVRLTDVLDTAGLKYPHDKGACFVTITSANSPFQPALFSCGELYNSKVGRGDGLSGETSRSRHKGVLLVTDDFREGSSSPVMMACWASLDTCTMSTVDGNLATSYTSAISTANSVNKRMVALVSTEDYVPFQIFGRWFPYTRTTADAKQCQGPTNCIPWIDVGERLQQNIKTMTVYFAAGTGNGLSSGTDGGGTGGTGSGGSGAASDTVCTHDQVMSGVCVKADGSACSHLDYMADPNACFLPNS